MSLFRRGSTLLKRGSGGPDTKAHAGKVDYVYIVLSMQDGRRIEKLVSALADTTVFGICCSRYVCIWYCMQEDGQIPWNTGNHGV